MTRSCCIFLKVLDQTSLRADDTYKSGGRGFTETDRSWWEQRSNASVLANCDELLHIVDQESGQPHRLLYRKKLIDLVSTGNEPRRIFCIPMKRFMHLGVYIPKPEAWVLRFQEAGIPATLRRGNKAVRITIEPEDFNEQRPLILEFVKSALSDEDENEGT